MQHAPRYTLLRRILYPYSGEEPLSLKQGLRVVLAWMLFFPLCMCLLTLAIAVLGSFTLQRMVMLLIFVFVSGVLIFGMLGLIIVSMGNKAARFRQTWNTRKDQQ
jgi:lipopolysaccharide export LptBFGC system permease protein LptF